jgi:hypothetical protein
MEEQKQHEEQQSENGKANFKEFIETCQEHELYFVIDEAGAFIWRMNHLAANGQIPEDSMGGVMKDMMAINRMQGEAAQETKRFGVNFELVNKEGDTSEETKQPCQEYWDWLKHWNNWKETFTDETWDAFIKAVESKGDLTSFLPKTKWSDK